MAEFYMLPNHMQAILGKLFPISHMSQSPGNAKGIYRSLTYYSKRTSLQILGFVYGMSRRCILGTFLSDMSVLLFTQKIVCSVDVDDRIDPVSCSELFYTTLMPKCTDDSDFHARPTIPLSTFVVLPYIDQEIKASIKYLCVTYACRYNLVQTDSFINYLTTTISIGQDIKTPDNFISALFNPDPAVFTSFAKRLLVSILDLQPISKLKAFVKEEFY